MQSFLESFNRIIGSINNSYHKAALKFSLSDSELSILYVLNVHGDSCSQSTLYKESGITKTTVNSSVKRMEKKIFLLSQQAKDVIPVYVSQTKVSPLLKIRYIKLSGLKMTYIGTGQNPREKNLSQEMKTMPVNFQKL